MKKILALILLTIYWSISQAKQDSTHTYSDTLNLAQHFSKGHVSGHFRNFLMSTINQGPLKDYWTNAMGMSLHYQSLPFKGFEFEMKGIFTFQTFSSNLNNIDPTVGRGSKWEVELYDILDRDNKTDLDRLEELFIHYSWKNSFVRYGRIPIDKTPLINQRDSRMKAFAFEGFHGNFGITKSLRAQTILLHGVSPRSTVEWFQMNEAIGLNGNGFSASGDKSDYLGHLNTHFILGQELSYKNKGLKINLWNYYLDKVFNLNWAQIEYKYQKWKLGVISVHQFAHNFQSRLSETNHYIFPDNKSNVFSSKIQRENDQLTLATSFTSMFGTGRFLFPKELGRESFYTSITRSRVEGLGKSKIANVSAKYKPKKRKELEFDMIFSYLDAAKETDYVNNKYGIRDCFHTVFEIDYNFEGKLKGLELDLLYIYRQDIDKQELTAAKAFNKTNFHQINLIMNINF